MYLPEPLTLFLLPVVGSALLGGVRPGLLAALIATVAGLVTLADPPFVTMTDNLARAIGIAVALPTTGALCGWVRDQLAGDQEELAERRNFTTRLRAFTRQVGSEPLDSVYDVIARRLQTS